MKTLRKLFAFASPPIYLGVQFWAVMLVANVIGAVNISLLVPMLQLLFADPDPVTGAFKMAETDNRYFQFVNWFLSIFIDPGENTRAQMLMSICGVIVSASLVANLMRYYGSLVMVRFQMALIKNIRVSLYNKITSLPITYFIDTQKGGLLSRVLNDTTKIQTSVGDSIFSLLRDPVKALTLLGVMFWMSWQLSLGALIIVPVLGTFISIIVKRIKGDAHKAQALLGNLMSILDETINGIKVIYGFGAVDQFQDKFEKENEYYSKTVRSLSRKTQLSSPVSEFLSTIMVALIVFTGGLLIFDNSSNITAEIFIGFIVAVSQLMQPIKQSTKAFTNLQEGLVSVERVLEIMDYRTEKQGVALRDTPRFAQTIQFDHIHFSYGDTEVISDMDFNIKKGESVAMVGPSGGGKTTVADLLCGFVKPTKGHIRMDGTEITDYTQAELSGLFGIVNQEAILFNDTVANNIAIGSDHLDMERVKRVAKIALADGFIEELSDGYDTVLGEKGDKLSGGQRQRICLARAIYREPEILILDEATSALDTQSEKLVQEALKNVMKGRTSLVIAHRLSTIKHADKILVVENGKIKDQGNHDQLMRTSEIYQRLNMAQEVA